MPALRPPMLRGLRHGAFMQAAPGDAVTAPTPSALTKRELDRRGWPWAQGEYFQVMGDPKDAGRLAAFLECVAMIESLSSFTADAFTADVLRATLGDLRGAVLTRAAAIKQREGPPGVKKDLFGYGDLLVLDGLPGSLLIQCTSASNASTRVSKIKSLDVARKWLSAGNRIQVWGWASRPVDEAQALLLRGARKPKMSWQVRIVPVTLDMFGA